MMLEKYKKEKIVHWHIQNVDSWGCGGKWGRVNEGPCCWCWLCKTQRKIVEKVAMLQEKSSDDHLPGGDKRNLVLLVEGACTDVYRYGG